MIASMARREEPLRMALMLATHSRGAYSSRIRPRCHMKCASAMARFVGVAEDAARRSGERSFREPRFAICASSNIVMLCAAVADGEQRSINGDDAQVCRRDAAPCCHVPPGSPIPIRYRLSPRQFSFMIITVHSYAYPPSRHRLPSDQRPRLPPNDRHGHHNRAHTVVSTMNIQR